MPQPDSENKDPARIQSCQWHHSPRWKSRKQKSIMMGWENEAKKKGICCSSFCFLFCTAKRLYFSWATFRSQQGSFLSSFFKYYMHLASLNNNEHKDSRTLAHIKICFVHIQTFHIYYNICKLTLTTCVSWSWGQNRRVNFFIFELIINVIKQCYPELLKQRKCSSGWTGYFQLNLCHRRHGVICLKKQLV